MSSMMVTSLRFMSKYLYYLRYKNNIKYTSNSIRKFIFYTVNSIYCFTCY